MKSEDRSLEKSFVLVYPGSYPFELGPIKGCYFNGQLEHCPVNGKNQTAVGSMIPL